jgi:hypothetical protein
MMMIAEVAGILDFLQFSLPGMAVSRALRYFACSRDFSGWLATSVVISPFQLPLGFEARAARISFASHSPRLPTHACRRISPDDGREAAFHASSPSMPHWYPVSRSTRQSLFYAA